MAAFDFLRIFMMSRVWRTIRSLRVKLIFQFRLLIFRRFEHGPDFFQNTNSPFIRGVFFYSRNELQKLLSVLRFCSLNFTPCKVPVEKCSLPPSSSRKVSKLSQHFRRTRIILSRLIFFVTFINFFRSFPPIFSFSQHVRYLIYQYG